MFVLRFVCGIILSTGVALYLQGCDSVPPPPPPPPVSNCTCFDRSTTNGVAVLHGEKDNDFWKHFKQTAETTADGLGVSFTFNLLDKFSDDAMAAKVKEEADKLPAFMITSLPGPKTVEAVKAIDPSVPVYAVNVGFDSVASIPNIVNFLGQDETAAGKMAGEKLLEAFPDMTKGIFVHPQDGNAAMTARSAGFKAALDAKSVAFLEIAVDEGDAEHVKTKVEEKLTQAVVDSKVGILVGGNRALESVLAQVAALNGGPDSGKTAVLAFDTTAPVQQALKDGTIIGTVDQGAWLQAWLPVIIAGLKSYSNVTLARKVLTTGPGMITEPLTDTKLKCVQEADCDWGSIKTTIIADAVEGDRFWDILVAGAKSASRDLGVEVEIPRLDGFDVEKMYAEFHDFSKDENHGPAGCAVPTPGFFDRQIKGIASRAPMMTLNSGRDASKALGAINHLGQDEVAAGKKAGTELMKNDCKKAFCIVYSRGLKALTDRCKGFKEAVGAVATEEYVRIKLDENLTIMEESYRAFLEEKQPDCVLLTSASRQWRPFSAAVGNESKVAVGVFDVTYGVSEALQDGTIDFVVDQQAYLQGYGTVALLAASALTGENITTHDLATGPIMKYKDESESVACQDAGFPICGVEEKASVLDVPVYRYSRNSFSARRYAAAAGAAMCVGGLAVMALTWRRQRHAAAAAAWESPAMLAEEDAEKLE